MHSLPMEKPLEFESVREVPDTHAWPNLHDYPSADPSGPDSVPVIDLSDANVVTAAIGHACETWGVFQVTGHGISIELLDRLEAEARRLFSLPTYHKLKAARSPDDISGYGLARISSFFSKLMWSEGFTISGSPIDHARKLWPKDHAHFCEVIEEYNKEMKKLAERLMQLMLLSLGFTEDDMKWSGSMEELKDVSSVLQLNSYPSCPDPDRAMGLAAHTDSSLVTILYQSNTSGLQVLRTDDETGSARWVTVPPIPGALVINVGDLGHILSNGRFKSILHRAVVNHSRHRISAAYICGPPANVKISPIQKPMDHIRGPAYRAVTWREYLGLKARLFDKALASIRVPEEDHSNSNACVLSCV